MRCLFVCADDFLWRWPPTRRDPAGARLVVEQPRARARIPERGARPCPGASRVTPSIGGRSAPATSPCWWRSSARARPGVLAAIRRVAPAAPARGPGRDRRAGAEPLVTLPPAARGRPPCWSRPWSGPSTRARVERRTRALRRRRARADPDAGRSGSRRHRLRARAAHRCWGATKTAAPIAHLRHDHPSREPRDDPDPRDRRRADRRRGRSRTTTGWRWSTPSRASSRSAMGEVDLVIDHHPEETPVRATPAGRPPLLRRDLHHPHRVPAAPADVKIRERLATALLYGIKTDTLHLERGATRADMEAFAFLHALANHNAAAPHRAAGPARRGARRAGHGHRAAPARRRRDVRAPGRRRLPGAGRPVRRPPPPGRGRRVVGGLRPRQRRAAHLGAQRGVRARRPARSCTTPSASSGSAGGHRSMAKAVVRLRDWRAARLAHRRGTRWPRPSSPDSWSRPARGRG